ncbi:MAG TPA: NERD domain-containing protein [Streptosporangiaceae bacterium]|nr:NERD domain-containing protein [Streptosporangiaceae bacterium]
MVRVPQRWTEVTRSQFSHEAEGLNLVRALLPPRDPFRAWSNFEFRDGHGRWHEVDLLVLGERRLHLVELKYYSGTLRGDDHIWLREGRRPEDSPLKLARRKAQRLAGKLQGELITWANEKQTRVPDVRSAIPYVQESVFLHHPDFQRELPSSARLDLFGLNGSRDRSGLPGISSRLLEPATPDQAITSGRSAIIAELMSRIGAVQRRQREAGSWIIDEEPLGEGDGWQDWPAFHKVATTDRARIRFLVTAPGAAAAERAARRRLAEHEYRVTSRLAHNGLVGPIDLVDGDLGVGLVYRLDERFQRLDLWLADQSQKVSVDDQFSVIRQVAEAVSFAHGNRIVHRGLHPHAIWVRRAADGTVRVQVRDWQSAGSYAGAGLTGSSAGGVTGLASPQGQLSPGSTHAGIGRPVAADVDQRLAETFQAPEGIWSPDADRVRLDVFALGALAYFILSARPAAADRTSLRERLRRSDGLDLAADLPQVATAVRELVLEATRPKVSDRLGDVRAFLAKLSDAEKALTPAGEDAVAGPLTEFFRKALARSAARRHETAAGMLRAWRSVFAPVPKTMPADADAIAAQAQPSTPLAEAGLSQRGLSALRPFGVQTVGDLIAIDPVRLNHMRGVADSTRREVKSRANQWRHRFAASVTGRGAAVASGGLAGQAVPDPVAAAELLAARAGSARAEARRKVARILLGLEPGLEPFASQAELSAVLAVSAGRTAQQVGVLQDAWAGDLQCRMLLDALGDLAAQSLTDLGGVATVAELAGTLLATLPPAEAGGDESRQARIAAGLLRVALDRNQALGRADEHTAVLSTRRRAGKVILLANDPALLDPAEAVERAADQLVEAAEAAGEPLIPPARAIPRLEAAWSRAAATSELAGEPAPAGLRLLRLAAALSEKAALSGSRELHSVGLPVATALRLALTGAASVQKLTQQEIKDRLRARFPALPQAPDRPRLDQLIADAQLGLIYDETLRAYRQPTRSGDSTRFSSRLSIGSFNPQPDQLHGSRAGHRLGESSSSRSFLALGIDWAELDQVIDALRTVFGAVEVDITSQLIAEMRRQAAEVGLPWDTVRAADAAPPGGREALGLSVLVQRSLPAIDEAIDAACAAAPEGTRPILLTEAGPLARYGHLTMLAPRADLATRRSQAIWLAVPQLPGNQGPVIDGRALPLAAPGQFYRLDLDSLRGESLSTSGGLS